MKSSLTTLGRALSLTVALAALLVLNHGVARADEITLSGSTHGIIIGVPQLTFAANNFTGTTVLGTGSLSGANNLGTLTLNTDTEQTVSGTFTLTIGFSTPSGIAGGGNVNFMATITGSVSTVVDQGGVLVHFANPQHTFSFSNASSTGSFTLTLADVFVQTGRTAELTAGFTGSQTAVPEPTTLLLLGTGLTGLAGVARRRMKRGKDS